MFLQYLWIDKGNIGSRCRAIYMFHGYHSFSSKLGKRGQVEQVAIWNYNARRHEILHTDPLKEKHGLEAIVKVLHCIVFMHPDTCRKDMCKLLVQEKQFIKTLLEQVLYFYFIWLFIHSNSTLFIFNLPPVFPHCKMISCRFLSFLSLFLCRVFV